MNKRIICSIFMFFFFFESVISGGHGWGQSGGNRHMQRLRSGSKMKTRSVVDYAVPDVSLYNHEGDVVNLRELMDVNKPVLLEFIFTTCATICPILSAGFANFQNKLGTDAVNVMMISVTIDPEYDSPEVLKEYSERYGAKAGWEFLTGSRNDIDDVMKAFDAYVTNKMDHSPFIYFHAPGGNKWVRINGLMKSSELKEEYLKLLEE